MVICDECGLGCEPCEDCGLCEECCICRLPDADEPEYTVGPVDIDDMQDDQRPYFWNL